jgi:AMP-binding enzyme C-terminal domain
LRPEHAGLAGDECGLAFGVRAQWKARSLAPSMSGRRHSHPSVLEAAVVGRPDPLFGEEPVAFVVLGPGLAAQPDELIEHCTKVLAKFKVPRDVFIEANLPRTAIGKIAKPVLRAHLIPCREHDVTAHTCLEIDRDERFILVASTRERPHDQRLARFGWFALPTSGCVRLGDGR